MKAALLFIDNSIHISFPSYRKFKLENKKSNISWRVKYIETPTINI